MNSVLNEVSVEWNQCWMKLDSVEWSQTVLIEWSQCWMKSVLNEVSVEWSQCWMKSDGSRNRNRINTLACAFVTDEYIYAAASAISWRRYLYHHHVCASAVAGVGNTSQTGIERFGAGGYIQAQGFQVVLLWLQKEVWKETETCMVEILSYCKGQKPANIMSSIHVYLNVKTTVELL